MVAKWIFGYRWLWLRCSRRTMPDRMSNWVHLLNFSVLIFHDCLPSALHRWISRDLRLELQNKNISWNSWLIWNCLALSCLAPNASTNRPPLSTNYLKHSDDWPKIIDVIHEIYDEYPIRCPFRVFENTNCPPPKTQRRKWDKGKRRNSLFWFSAEISMVFPLFHHSTYVDCLLATVHSPKAFFFVRSKCHSRSPSC